MGALTGWEEWMAGGLWGETRWDRRRVGRKTAVGIQNEVKVNKLRFKIHSDSVKGKYTTVLSNKNGRG